MIYKPCLATVKNHDRIVQFFGQVWDHHMLMGGFALHPWRMAFYYYGRAYRWANGQSG